MSNSFPNADRAPGSSHNPDYILTQSEAAQEQDSMFFDRWDGHFLRYVTGQLNLPFDASDREIAALMTADLDARGTHVIYDFDYHK